MFAQRTIRSEDLENTLILGEKYASRDQTSFFSQTSIFENSCLGPLNWNIHHCVEVTNFWPVQRFTGMRRSCTKIESC